MSAANSTARAGSVHQTTINALASQLTELLPFMSEKEQAELDRLLAGVRPPAWSPFERQVAALECPADELLYGGAAGGGKTDLLLGLALTEHTRSIIFRREYSQLQAIRERAEEIFEPVGGKYNGQRELWRFDAPLARSEFVGKRVEFGAVQFEGDEKKFQGRPHDLKAFDEITHFSRSQYKYLTGWRRSPRPGQRTRVVCAGNPPTSAEGDWVLDYWAPWLRKDHPRPAKPGELRYFYTDGEGADVECGEDYVPGSKIKITYEDGTEDEVLPQSRSFIPSRVEDNPYYMATGYKSVLQSLPEPLRSRMLRGDFEAGVAEDEWQVIPTEWIKLAQSRWRPTYEEFVKGWLDWLSEQAQEQASSGSGNGTSTSEGTVAIEVETGDVDVRPVYAPPKDDKERADLVAKFLSLGEAREVGVDVSRGGRDKTTMVEKRGLWFNTPVKVPGIQTRDGNAVIQEIVRAGYGDAKLKIDVSTIGSSPVDIGKMLKMDVVAMNPAEKDPHARDRSRKLRFHNCRAQWWWQLREMLDPKLGAYVGLPPGSEVVADLSAPRWELRPSGVLIEPKQKIKERIKRSPDVGDAIVNAAAKPYVPGEGVYEFTKELAGRSGNDDADARAKYLRHLRGGGSGVGKPKAYGTMNGSRGKRGFNPDKYSGGLDLGPDIFGVRKK